MSLRYGTFCSGIRAPEVAWRNLGWTPVFASDIDAFANAVGSHHFPDVPNLGDMEQINDEQIRRYPVDLVCAGTPCQAFSVAGLRKGLDDPRGNLTLVFLRLLDALRPRWLVWENVPGVLSDGGNAFGAFVGGLVELGYGVCWRILDAQYFGVPQRRRRVFVVGYLGDWRRAAAVLFERESLSGYPAPSREAGKDVAGCLGASPKGRGWNNDLDRAGAFPVASTGEVAHCLNAGGMGRQDYETETLVTHALRGDGFDASEDGTGRGTPIVPVAFAQNQLGEVRVGSVMNTLNTNSNASGRNVPLVAFAQKSTVRRLLPVECERLQAFPDSWTNVPYRGKPAADGPRYRAIGNSMCVNVMRWIGERIQIVEDIEDAV